MSSHVDVENYQNVKKMVDLRENFTFLFISCYISLNSFQLIYKYHIKNRTEKPMYEISKNNIINMQNQAHN